MTERRCSHLGQSCLHRPIPPQAYRMDELPPFSWREVGEIIGGTVVLSIAFLVIFFYFAVIAVQV